ncbi:hypothetical protein [Chryseobacterium wanjuense]
MNINFVSNGKPFIYDTNHLTYYGAEQYKNAIKRAILEIMAKS